MKTFQITNTARGLDLGKFEAADRVAALEALAKDAGYGSYAEMCEVAPGDDLRVTAVET